MESRLINPTKSYIKFLIVRTNSQVLEPKPQSKISPNSSNIIQFSEIPTLEFLNEVLENDGSNGLDHSYSTLQKSQTDMDSPLSSLSSTPELVPNTSSKELRPQIPTKPPGFQYTA